MGSVDLLGMLLRSYRPNLPSKNWCRPLFSNALNNAVVAAFEIHKNVCTDQMSHLDLRAEVAEMMISANHEAQRVRLGCSTAPVPEEIKLAGINHTWVPTSQCRCIGKSNGRLICSKCDKRLHEKACHKLYHSK